MVAQYHFGQGSHDWHPMWAQIHPRWSLQHLNGSLAGRCCSLCHPGNFRLPPTSLNDKDTNTDRQASKESQQHHNPAENIVTWRQRFIGDSTIAVHKRRVSEWHQNTFCRPKARSHVSCPSTFVGTPGHDKYSLGRMHTLHQLKVFVCQNGFHVCIRGIQDAVVEKQVLLPRETSQGDTLHGVTRKTGALCARVKLRSTKDLWTAKTIMACILRGGGSAGILIIFAPVCCTLEGTQRVTGWSKRRQRCRQGGWLVLQHLEHQLAGASTKLSLCWSWHAPLSCILRMCLPRLVGPLSRLREIVPRPTFGAGSPRPTAKFLFLTILGTDPKLAQYHTSMHMTTQQAASAQYNSPESIHC